MSDEELSPRQKMNVWCAKNIEAYQSLLGQASAAEDRKFLAGTIAGIRILQDAWLIGKFDGVEE